MKDYKKYKKEADKILAEEYEEKEKESEVSIEEEKELKPPKIRLTRFTKKIKYKQKKIGKYKFTDIDREILFALMGMPIDLDELREFFEFTDEELKESFTKLEKKHLVKPVGTEKKKKTRGDFRFNIYWLLTEKGEIVAENLLKYTNKELKKEQ